MTTPSTTPLTVAVLGTGTMGAGMARNIAAAGVPLQVWNRSRDRAQPLAEVGATVAATPAEAVDGADVVLTMLWDAAAVADVLRAAGPSLRAGAVLVQSSTVGVEGFARVDAVVRQLGLVHVDAPVLGTKQPAEQGRLVVLASGPEDARTRVQPVLDAVGSRTLWLGQAGEGSRLKLAANAFVFTVLAGTAQSLALTRALGLDPARFLEAVGGGPVDSPYVQLKGRAMLDGALDPAFALAGALKDARLALEAVAGSAVDASVLDAVVRQQEAAVAAGLGELDMAAIVRVVDPAAPSGG